MHKKDRPNLMLIGMGVLGGGPLGEGIPVIVDLFNRLSKYYDITFYSFGPTNPAHIPKTINIKQVLVWRIPGRLKYILLSIQIIWDHLRNPYSVIFAVSVYPTGLVANWLGKLLNRHVIIQLIALEAVALPDIGYGNLTKPWLRRITEKVCREAGSLVVVAEYQKEIAKRSLQSSREMIVLPLRIDSRKFNYRKRSITTPVQFIQIAYYSPIKDQDTMFVAFAHLATHIDCHLTVVGDGFNIPKIHTLLRELKIVDRVALIGSVRQAELPQYLDQAHILLHTARFETGCAVIQEAMASGVAVCGTDVGILADIGDRYAVIVPPGSPQQLAGGVLDLISSPQRYDEITLNAYQWITENGAEWAARNYQSLIEKHVS